MDAFLEINCMFVSRNSVIPVSKNQEGIHSVCSNGPILFYLWLKELVRVGPVVRGWGAVGSGRQATGVQMLVCSKASVTQSQRLNDYLNNNC